LISNQTLKYFSSAVDLKGNRLESMKWNGTCRKHNIHSRQPPE